jgi:hypothetical protein
MSSTRTAAPVRGAHVREAALLRVEEHQIAGRQCGTLHVAQRLPSRLVFGAARQGQRERLRIDMAREAAAVETLLHRAAAASVGRVEKTHRGEHDVGGALGRQGRRGRARIGRWWRQWRRNRRRRGAAGEQHGDDEAGTGKAHRRIP